MLAAAGLFALENHVDRLKEDHARARALGELLAARPEVESLLPVETNIVVARLVSAVDPNGFLRALNEMRVRAVPFGAQTIRMVTHLDFSDDDLSAVAEAIGNINLMKVSG